MPLPKVEGLLWLTLPFQVLLASQEGVSLAKREGVSSGAGGCVLGAASLGSRS